MNVSLFLSMSVFALVASISPGPVNLVGLNSGAHFGLKTGLWFVTGATVGFTLLFIAVGMGLYSALSIIPGFSTVLRWSGIIFLLYLSVGMLKHDGQVSSTDQQKAPGFLTGAVMQWLNPKAWVASASGIGALAGGGDLYLTTVFALIYFVVCWLSLSCWVFVGLSLRSYADNPRYMRYLNRVLAALLIICCLALVI